MKKLVPEGAVLIPDTAQRVFEGVIFDVYQWDQELFDGTHTVYEMLKRPDTVTVIPIVGDKILTIEDDQPHTGMKLSFPGGKVDKKDESTVAAIQREVSEETGYEFKHWKLVKVIQPHMKLEWFIYIYIAWDGRKVVDPHPDSGEKIKINKLPFTEAKNFVVTKSGYLGESMEVFAGANSTKDLIQKPEFKGHEVDR